MAGKVVTLVQQKLEPIITQMGYELVEVEYTKKNTGMNLTVFLANEKGITLNDCEKVHNIVDSVLDEIDPTDGAAYTLNVSSLGLDRVFKTTRDYERYLNKEIDIKLYSPLDGKKSFSGKLVSITDEQVVIDNGKQIILERKKIAASQPHLDF